MLDVHVVSQHIRDLILPMARAGATRFIFQYENLIQHDGMSKEDTYQILVSIANEIRAAGMRCGICIAPETPVTDSIIALLNRKWPDEDSENLMIEMIDILAVNPGIGGQSFNAEVLSKIKIIRNSCDARIQLAVDGGINTSSISQAYSAGADIFIAGTAIFSNDRKVDDGPLPLRENMKKLYDSIS